MNPSPCRRPTILLAILCMAGYLAHPQSSLQSEDSYVRREGDEWTIGTSLVEKRIRLANGRFVLTSLRNKKSGREYQDPKNPSEEIRLLANGQDVSASNWHWKLRSEHAARGQQGEIQLDIELESAVINVTKHYVIYPGTPVIREWLSLENSSGKPVRISDVDFLHTRVLGSTARDSRIQLPDGRRELQRQPAFENRAYEPRL